MLPKNPALNSFHCLTSLMGVRSECDAATLATAKEFWIEDIDGYDAQKLSKLARGSHLKGSSLASWLIDSAAREMMGDLELLMNNGYSVKSMVGDMCSSCSFLPSYAPGSGVVVKTTSPSNLSQLVITKLTILANVTGTREFIIDDGVTPKPFNVDLQAGVQIPVIVDYKTYQKSVKIYFTDATVPLGLIQCATTSSCGCGKTSADATSPITIAGLLNGTEGATQYGFLVCAGVACSYDLLVCNMIKKTPRIFGLVLSFKVAEKLTLQKNMSERNNEVASYGETGGEELQRNYGQLYWAKLKGTNRGEKGLKDVIQSYLKTVTWDSCIDCQTKIYSSFATG